MIISKLLPPPPSRLFSLVKTFIVFLFIGLIPSSCSKNKDNLKVEVLTVNSYYFDNDFQSIVSITIDGEPASSENLATLPYIAVDFQKRFDDDELPIVDIYGFNTREMYEEWGDLHDRNVRLELSVYDHLRNYAEESGIIEESERTGIIPEWYLEYHDKYLKRYLNNNSNTSGNNRLALEIRDGIEGNQPSPSCSGATLVIPHGGIPNLWLLGWCNRPSAVRGVGFIGGHVTLFDNSWYRGQMGSFWYFNLDCIPFTGVFSNFNNRTCSLSNVNF